MNPTFVKIAAKSSHGDLKLKHIKNVGSRKTLRWLKARVFFLTLAFVLTKH